MNWDDVIQAFLHDPPDKGLGIRGHEVRAREYIQAALGREPNDKTLHQLADQLASISERVPAPRGEVLAVEPQNNVFTVTHPLAGDQRELSLPRLDRSAVCQEIQAISQGLTGRALFFALWRLLPERLSELHPAYLHLPADTRLPDHTIWQHLDVCAALQAAQEGGHGPAFLSFAIGPVQGFIATARSVRDLWTGSMILSWLTFQAMVPVIKEYGPTAVIYPSLRGLPFLDLWLKTEIPELADRLPDPDESLRLAPCIPNRFLALVPYGPNGELARTLAEQCERAVQNAWLDIAQKVHDRLHSHLASLDPDWDKRWHHQVKGFWDIRTAVLPWREATDTVISELLTGTQDFSQAFPDAVRVRQLADLIPSNDRPSYSQKHAGSWQAKVDLSARLMQAQRSVRHIPSYSPLASGSWSPPKCSLMGTYEQMGPDGLDASRKFWEAVTEQLSIDGVRLRQGERLCAIALVKRFAGPAYFRHKLSLSHEALRFEDTAAIAAQEWLQAHPEFQKEAEARRHCQWIHWLRRNQEQEEEEIPHEVWQKLAQVRKQDPPPAYYAILMIDGDNMGGWLRGDNSPKLKQVMHPELLRYFEHLNPLAQQCLEARRPVGPALHTSISNALANFALHFVPKIVEGHLGTLVYAGGDDVLALLPISQALRCAHELYDTYRKPWQRDNFGIERLLMGPKATLSGSLVIAHHKEDLRYALNEARAAEKAAKNAGRDILQISLLRRSGEHSSALCPWNFIPSLLDLLEAYQYSDAKPPASDRWIYRLHSELATLEGLDLDAVTQEIKRQVNRSDHETRTRLGKGNAECAADKVVGYLRDYCQALTTPAGSLRHSFDTARVIREFVTLLHIIAFLSRGRNV